MKAIQAVILEPHKTGLREVEISDPTPDQFLVETKVSAISAGTELAVYTGSHQWLKDPSMPDWKFPFRPGYSAAGVVLKVGKNITGLKEVEKYRVDENCKPCPIYKTENRTNSADEFFQFLSIIK